MRDSTGRAGTSIPSAAGIGPAMTDDSPEALIARLVAGEESFVTRWVVIAEMIESDGERVVICAGAEDMQRWDSYGLLTEALEVEKAHHLATRLEDGP